jgi:hypothetical protein
MSHEELDQLIQRIVHQAGLDRNPHLPASEFGPALTNVVAGISHRLGNVARAQRAA